MSADAGRVVWLGEICGVYGVKGWVKVRSFTDPRTNIFDYPKWRLDRAGRQTEVEVEATKQTGRQLVAKLRGIDDRDRARDLIGAGICVSRSDLPECAPGEYYWADLEGLAVVSRSGTALGRVERIMATGAHDVLVLDAAGRRMIPYVPGTTVLDVDLAAGRIVVDWDETYWE